MLIIHLNCHLKASDLSERVTGTESERQRDFCLLINSLDSCHSPEEVGLNPSSSPTQKTQVFGPTSTALFGR